MESDEEEVIEMLPDRFDAQGRPLDGSLPISRRGGSGPQWHSRRGDFEYRSPRGASGINMRGEWGVAGTDIEAVERIVQNVTGVLEGRGSWLGLVRGILSGSLLEGLEGGRVEPRQRIADRDWDSDRSEDECRRRRRKRDDDGFEDRRRRRGDERGDSSRHAVGRRGRGREWEYYDDDDDDDDRYHDGDRKRRRRTRDDLYERGFGRSETWG